MTSQTDFKLTIATIPKVSELPSEESAVSAARALISSVTEWKRGKSFDHGVVHTYSKHKGAGDGAGWHCRVSEHGPDDATFDEFWRYLGIEHAINEKEYIKVVKKATLVKEIAPNQGIWSMYYEFPTFGVSSRVFTALQIAHLEDTDGKRTGFFIQIPVDLSDQSDLTAKEEKGVKGHYVSVERFKELDNGKVEWRMATSSSPGGHIPSFLVESTMAGQIAADVSHFLKWLRSVRQKEGSAVQVKDTVAPASNAAGPAPEVTPGIATQPEVDAMKASIGAPTGTVPPTAA